MHSFFLLMQPGGQVLSSREYSTAQSPRRVTHYISRPLNTSATRDDISHVLKLVQPTHVATIEEKLNVLQDALASQSMTNTKILTVNFKEGNLPQVCSSVSFDFFDWRANNRLVPKRCYRQKSHRDYLTPWPSGEKRQGRGQHHLLLIWNNWKDEGCPAFSLQPDHEQHHNACLHAD
jgi:hypothetical protein